MRSDPDLRLRQPTLRLSPTPSVIDNDAAMNAKLTRARRVPAGIRAGVLATITMDLAMVTAARYGGDAFASDRVSPNLIGRWSAGLLRGRWRHHDITTEPEQPGEFALGIATHYATGIILAQAFLMLPQRGNRRASFSEATGYGIATAVLPFLILFPSMGFGWFGLRSGEAACLNRTMALGHVAFGVGIGLFGRPGDSRR